MAPPDRADLDAISRIKDEGLQRSEVMETAWQLTEVFGPRLTNSPGMRAAGEWAITRLTEMGIEPFLVASSVNLICAQRLVRRICTNCKVEHPLPPQGLIDAGFSPDDAESVVPMRGEGCDRCNRTGYKGRVGLYEVMDVNEQLRELILVGASALELRRKAVEDGMLTLRMSGLRKVKEGLTTIEEVARETVK